MEDKSEVDGGELSFVQNNLAGKQQLWGRRGVKLVVAGVDDPFSFLPGHYCPVRPLLVQYIPHRSCLAKILSASKHHIPVSVLSTW
jgi:hypothetical protein